MSMPMLCFIDNNFHDGHVAGAFEAGVTFRIGTVYMTLTGLEHPQFFSKIVCETCWLV